MFERYVCRLKKLVKVLTLVVKTIVIWNVERSCGPRFGNVCPQSPRKAKSLTVTSLCRKHALKGILTLILQIKGKRKKKRDRNLENVKISTYKQFPKEKKSF